MNKTTIKIFLSFSFVSAIIATMLLVMNALGIGILITDTGIITPKHSPTSVLEDISLNLEKTDTGYTLANTNIPSEYWCILLNDDGNIVWSQNKPDDIPTHYSIRDIAKLTHWFLCDYPVFVRTENCGLLILGIPKNAVGKYELIYSMKWFDTLPERIVIILLINLAIALLLSLIFGRKLYGNLKTVTSAINDLRSEKTVNLPEKGIFRDVRRNINETSKSMLRKNAILSERDKARINWIAGISHDIRTPLAIIMGNAEELENSPELTENSRKKATAAKKQSIKIKKLIEDLNLISSLEYDMQPSKKHQISVCQLIREIVCDIYNNIGDKYSIDVELGAENAIVLGDENLLGRAFFNIINNSIVHNKDGCAISISEYVKDKNVFIEIKDDGSGFDNAVIQNSDEILQGKHGLGLSMTRKIVKAHGGTLKIQNNNGCVVTIKIPTE